MSVQLPKFLTFSGADDATSIADMIALSNQYPVEFGILGSRSNGRERYPSIEWIAHLVAGFGIARQREGTGPLAIHLCGEFSRDALTGDLVPELEPFFRQFQRIQFNAPPLHPTAYNVAKAFASARNLVPIAQCRGFFPLDISISWLLDESAGNGKPRETWPRDDHYQPESEARRLVGYAGGINRENISEVIAAVGTNRPDASTYWLDMETGLRKANASGSAFDLNVCADICEHVYGARSSG